MLQTSPQIGGDEADPGPDGHRRQVHGNLVSFHPGDQTGRSCATHTPEQ